MHTSDRHPVQPAAPAEEEDGQFRALVEGGADAVLVVSPDGTIVYANPAAGALLGRPHRELVGRQFGTPVVGGETTEVDLLRADGSAGVAEMRAVALTWRGQPAQFASLRDVTDRKRAEAALAEAGRRKDEFLAMLAHELRNPLAPIRNAVYLLRARTAPDAPGRDTLDMMDRQVEHMARLLDDLLDVSRVTHGAIRLQKVPLDAGEVIARAVETAGPHVDARRHSLVVEAEPGPHPLHGDLARLVQVVSNLLINAAKYTPDGGRIAVSLRREGNDAVVRVRDNGVGIQPELVPHLFETFAQGARSLARSEGGLGLGLALVRSLTELHGGTVHGRSDGPGKGAEFEVRLPLALPREPAPRPAEPAKTRSATPLRILVVDDNVDAADSLVQVLELLGHVAEAAYDGPSGVAGAVRYRPDLVFLDIGLPDMDGYAVARALRAAPEAAGARIVALSGYAQDADRARSREAGFDDHLMKPLDSAALVRALDEALRRAR